MEEATVAGIGAAMERAVELAAKGPVNGPNPRVGCVILAPKGPDGRRRVLAEGFHAGAGTAHAEAAAVAHARTNDVDLQGSTAVVTLEPCAHHGRTGPCTEALIDAGVAEVAYAVDDPNPLARGGATVLRDADVRVSSGMGADAVEDLLRVWLTAVRRGTPYVTAKIAVSLDGKVAAPDGTSRWITGPQARAHAHEVRAQVDAIAVGTGTVLADDPALTARTPDGTLAGSQPLRVVMGLRGIPAAARVRGPRAPLLHLRTHDLDEALADLAGRGIRHLLVEGGPGLTTAFLRAGLVDELHAYVAPVLLGAGKSAVGDLGVRTIGQALRWSTVDAQRVGDDVVMVLRAGEAPGSVRERAGREQ